MSMRQKVIRTITYEGHVIQKMRDEVWRRGKYGATYYPVFYYWVPKLEDDFDRIKDGRLSHQDTYDSPK